MTEERYSLQLRDDEYYVRVLRYVPELDDSIWIDLYGFETVPGTNKLEPHYWVNFKSIDIEDIFPLFLTQVRNHPFQRRRRRKKKKKL